MISPHVVFRLTDELWFPPLTDRRYGEKRQDGLIAVGGDLSVERLLLAYRSGIFPWPHHHLPQDEEHLLWFSPDPRSVLLPQNLHVPHSLEKLMRKHTWTLQLDQRFGEVVQGCADHRRNDEVKHGEHHTWINTMMVEAYDRLHEAGWAHSVEVTHDGNLVGGFYGLAIGACFFGESMFTKVPNASKLCFVKFAQALRDAGYLFVDCQVHSEHMARFGAKTMPRINYLQLLKQGLEAETQGQWKKVIEAFRTV